MKNEERELQTKSIRYDQVIMCPKCFHGELVEITETVKVKPKDTKLLTHYIENMAIYRSDMAITCGNCGETTYGVPIIDADIYPTIKVLNEKGYITRFCCSGHEAQDYIGPRKANYSAYISFVPPSTTTDQLKLHKNITENFPESWYIDHEGDDVPKEITIRVHEEVQKNDPEKNYLKDILSWAQQLPKFEW